METKTLPILPKYDNDNYLSDTNIKQIPSYVHIPDRKILPRALAVLPSVLQIRNGVIYPRRSLPAHVRFGPVQGVTSVISHEEENRLIVQSVSSMQPVFLSRKNDVNVTYIDTSDRDKSNWIGLLPLGSDETANVWLHEEDDELYGYTLTSLTARTPLVLGYSEDYAKDHGFPLMTLPSTVCKGIQSNDRRWWCYECQHNMATAALLQHHMDVYHKEEKPLTRRKYRCKQCTKTFSRLFTLKRHVTLHCTKNTVKINEDSQNNQTPSLSDMTINQSFNADESRIPSDESFNNYTNGIDFNNLFDTDRISNLDVSGVSTSEVDFNPYSVISRDESCLTNVLDFTRFPSDNDTLCHSEVFQDKEEEIPKLISCPTCNQTIERENKRNHVRVCPGLKFYCECGQYFSSSQKLRNHVASEHPNQEDTDMVPKNATESHYKCEECEVNFKRRGMLVNHMWRVHKTSSVSVPLEKRVRHYPCTACPKIYRTAAKRDRHVKIHHPGAEISSRRSIQGGIIACRPAICSGCPRQYATRAKLLQHVRASHPNLAPPKKKNLLNSPKNS
ncbi:PR domain zinc finger protein 10-like [Battus philenor]|uniref:PR domain zinc finger protein 10-like n=1 Tax=Battus philenor TaxID=42288 RepID=UPI0035D0DBFB